MKAVFKHLFYNLLFSISFASLNAQNFELLVSAKDSTNNSVLTSITYNKEHTTEKSIQEETILISKKLAFLGYINNSYLLNKKDSIYHYTYTLNKKIDTILIKYSNKNISNNILNKISANYTASYFEITTNKIEFALNSIVTYFENKGASFTNASLINIQQEGNKLIAELKLVITEERKINAVIIKGYDEFPKKYVRHHLNLETNSTFNLTTLNNLDKRINTIPFTTQLKKPEVLFTKDSTALFLYLKKKATSIFDGIIGFSNDATNNKLIFNGYLDLTLNNIFNKGETFGFNWKNNGSNTQTLNLEFRTPYIFNTPFSTSGDFSILKQDSTYVNTKSQLNINYNINSNHSVNALLNNESSNLNSLQNTSIAFSEFKNSFIGLSYTYRMLNNNLQTSKPAFLATAGYLTGNRTTLTDKTHQDKLRFFTECTLALNMQHSIYIKSTNELLNAANLLQNELFRIGGANSIRGFDEQSIFTSKYSVTNIEYHYAINQTTHIYSITDVALLNDNSTNSTSTLFGIGLGYYFNTNYSIVNISYAIGKIDESTFNLNNSKVHIKITYPF
ncbi:hypothetical protein [uncultured Lutibacter sp.]|uniref:BamA/TamA family outer membrane protein n=1 Tax=uncultured Lutibacter sp. TaxID=437739 RepID=UPI0026372FF9|nr:hypothetical protein [uncultured Lutibacter sp.]